MLIISSFLLSTGGQGSEQRHFNSPIEGQESLRPAILYDYNNKSNEKQVKETVPTWSQNWLFLSTFPPLNQSLWLQDGTLQLATSVHIPTPRKHEFHQTLMDPQRMVTEQTSIDPHFEQS